MKTSSFRILVIDDNPAIHRDFMKILNVSKSSILLNKFDEELFDNTQHPGLSLPEFEIDVASQGIEGIEKVKRSLEEGRPYALAFIDIRMPPGIDGIETITRIWAIDPEMQIVICSAYSDYSWEETVNALGLSDNLLVLKKPFDVIAVRQLASALTQKWVLAKETQKHTEFLNQLVDERTESLQQSLSLLRATIESSSDGILVVDLQGKIVDYNMQFVKLWNITESSMKKANEPKLIKDMSTQLLNSDQHALQVKEFSIHIDDSSIQTYYFKNGNVVECCSKPHRVGSQTVGRVWSFRDITEQAKLKEKLEYQATHDALTKLPNRLLLIDRIEHIISSHARYKKKFAVLFFDLDRFKMINDSLSHDAGDQLLCAVAERLRSLARKEDTLSRLGGDEFVMIFPSLGSEAQIVTVAQKILKSFLKPFHVTGKNINVYASIGISVYPTDGKTVNTLLSNADMAMYHAKFLGGNQFSFYTNKLNKQTSLQFQQELDLQKAIINHEFFLLYQPQFEINTRQIRSMEALIRWNHPKKGIILPLDFIPTAESSGLIVPIGEWVLRETCRQIREWRKKGLPEIPVACNVASKQLRQRNFLATVQSILQEYSIEPQWLEIEITENVIIDREIQKIIKKLKSMGVQIILDDFGTGNSSLNLLKQVAVDSLKIDQSFIQNISKSPGDEAIIDAIIAIAQSMNFNIIAEGVETQNQFQFLKKRQCHDIQGFLMSKPLSPEEAARLLREKNV
ncbi:GGDEF/EAL domain-containing response regulator [Legionella feeleii]|uniref:GGDEF domain-containing sensory box protein n=2 Tax=Legionella feeleii TaxID=453 RepID=A0A0W0TM55_9GAMM|nr:EAL domain-containing protein [Legionella feeleii]KTC96687.1 GGDEF domain-containing sensory box protein [Legionella feeleii]